MFTDDDVLVTRWTRWQRRVQALNVDTLLRWTLVAAIPSLVISSVLMALAMVGALLRMLVGLVS